MPLAMTRRISRLEDRIYSDSDRLVLAVRCVDRLGETAAEIDRQVDECGLPRGCAAYLTVADVEPVGPIRLRDLTGKAERCWFDATSVPHALVVEEDGQRLRLLMRQMATDRDLTAALADFDDQPVIDLVRVN